MGTKDNIQCLRLFNPNVYACTAVMSSLFRPGEMSLILTHWTFMQPREVEHTVDLNKNVFS